MNDRIQGGLLHTRRVAVGATPTLLTTAISTVAYRKAVLFINDSTVDVFLGGPDVAASGATKGIPILAVPATDPPTPADRFSESVGNQPIYGIVAAGTGHVIVAEWY
jgi:hypothetical protein